VVFHVNAKDVSSTLIAGLLSSQPVDGRKENDWSFSKTELAIYSFEGIYLLHKLGGDYLIQSKHVQKLSGMILVLP